MPAAEFQVRINPEHGGRWTSLQDPDGTEWLWTRQAPGRGEARPGDEFVDVGGVEECFPTIGGHPDHGDVWAREWRDDDGWLSVTSGTARLARRVTTSSDAVEAEYRLDDEPGRAFIWCAHVSLEPAIGTQVMAPAGHRVRAWPGHVRPVETSWPRVLGIDGYDVLGPDDGSAMFCVLPGLDELTVRAPHGTLRFSLSSDGPPVPLSFGVWRNLGGYPWSARPYRNFVVEPMLGRHLTSADADAGDHAVVPGDGYLTWRLRISR